MSCCPHTTWPILGEFSSGILLTQHCEHRRQRVRSDLAKYFKNSLKRSEKYTQDSKLEEAALYALDASSTPVRSSTRCVELFCLQCKNSQILRRQCSLPLYLNLRCLVSKRSEQRTFGQCLSYLISERTISQTKKNKK